MCVAQVHGISSLSFDHFIAQRQVPGVASGMCCGPCPASQQLTFRCPLLNMPCVSSVTQHVLGRAGFALAYSNRFAGQLSDLTVQRGMGNVGCFYGGGAAAVAAAVLIILFWKFGSLGQDPLEVEKRKSAQA